MSEPYRKPAFSEPPKSHLELSSAFRDFDHDHDGRIDFVGFAILVSVLGKELSHAKKMAEFHRIDRDRKGTIDFETFLSWWRTTR